MSENIFDRLVILEMANNHMGDVEHGLRIIREFAAAVKPFDFRCAIKFQYRDLDRFIHPDYRNRTDIKYIKRFSETRLAEADFLRLKAEAEKFGFLPMCTPFDETSVDLVEKHDFAIIKIASCSFTDWPLLERIARTAKPLIASTAGAALEEIDSVVSFLQHRKKEFCLMHCVGSYPTPAAELELNQIDFFRERYPDVPIGFSTHEEPGDFDPVKIAVAKGAAVLERHIGVATEKYPLNAYSSSPEAIALWLAAAAKARAMCGVVGRRRDISAKERGDLKGLQRGAFAVKALHAGEKIGPDKLFFAIPSEPGQLLANDLSKYKLLTATAPIAAAAPVLAGNFEVRNIREKVLDIIRELCVLIRESKVPLQSGLELELSHHYGIDRFHEAGCSIITCVNREYCKKIILLLPGQENPAHAHRRKEETFHVLYGDILLTLDGEEKAYSTGDIVVVERDRKHSFSSRNGAVLEEISTTHYRDDSFYDDPAIAGSDQRKTYMRFYSDWLTKNIM